MQNANQFVTQTVNLIQTDSWAPASIINCDQSGFEREIHSKRTLSTIGLKNVEKQVQNIGATTHSYTVMPMFSMDGRLLSPMLVVIPEKNGQFPLRGHFQVIFN